MIAVIKANGTIEAVTEASSLALVQRLVGGYIEAVPHFGTYGGEPCQAWCNEEGKLQGLPGNPKATELWAALVGHPAIEQAGEYLVGDIVILTGDDRLR